MITKNENKQEMNWFSKTLKFLEVITPVISSGLPF